MRCSRVSTACSACSTRPSKPARVQTQTSLLIGALALLLAHVAAPGSAVAHPGGLNAEGCHNNRKTGEYHCHRAARTAPNSFINPGRVTGSTRFRNCAEARAAGAAPVRIGDPGYAPHLDRDGDGVGCE